MRKLIVCLLLICPAFCRIEAQDGLGIKTKLQFIPVWQEKVVHIQEDASGLSGDTVSFILFRFYISGLSLWKANHQVWTERNSFHLLDAGHPESMDLSRFLPEGLDWNSIHFSLGIDSATSCSGAQGGELDPVKGMYWAWQSGYINFKLDGFSPMSQAKDHAFHFHLGGYQYPYSCIREIRMDAGPSQDIRVLFDLTKFLATLNLQQEASMMIPGARASLLSNVAAQCIYRETK